MGKIYLITGGAASGKSKFANTLAESLGGNAVAYIATAQSLDQEMAKKIVLHKKYRNKKWRVYEESEDLYGLIIKLKNMKSVILIECVSLFISNLMIKGLNSRKILKNIKLLMASLKARESDSIVVTNEVGQGIVPDNNLAREYREVLGNSNQIISQCASIVYFVVSGIPLKIK